jgi:hypothetical protein
MGLALFMVTRLHKPSIASTIQFSTSSLCVRFDNLDRYHGEITSPDYKVMDTNTVKSRTMQMQHIMTDLLY